MVGMYTVLSSLAVSVAVVVAVSVTVDRYDVEIVLVNVEYKVL